MPSSCNKTLRYIIFANSGVTRSGIVHWLDSPRQRDKAWSLYCCENPLLFLSCTIFNVTHRSRGAIKNRLRLLLCVYDFEEVRSLLPDSGNEVDYHDSDCCVVPIIIVIMSVDCHFSPPPEVTQGHSLIGVVTKWIFVSLTQWMAARSFFGRL